MKKILLTNNLEIVRKQYEKYYKIYTDSPYIVEHYKDAIYLDTLLDENLNEIINNIRKKGFEINRYLADKYFPKYLSLRKNLLNINIGYTNVYINVRKLVKLIEIHPNDEVIIAVSDKEVCNSESSPVDGISNRFMNCYYWLAEISKIKNLKAICVNKVNSKFQLLATKNDFMNAHSIGHSTINSWFLRLADLDKKVLIFNLLKKLKLVNKSKRNIFLYKKSYVIREIEPYLHDLGFNLIAMPEIKFKFQNTNDNEKYEKIKNILDKFFDDDPANNIFKVGLFEMYKYRIKYFSQREKFTENYISKLDKSIKFILTNTINGFDSNIFATQLQLSGYKIINIMHGLTSSFLNKIHLIHNESEAPDLTLCFNKSEKNMFGELTKNKLVQPISMVQEAKKKRFKFIKRFIANKILKIKDEVNIFYPSIIYPYNNVTVYGFRYSDKWNFEFEKKMISLLSNVNKRAIYKNYPMKSYLDPNSLIEYAKSFKNIKVIDENFDFRYVSSIGDIFILGSIGPSSTLTWMLGENKPIIYLYSNKFKQIREEGIEILQKSLIVIDIDEDEWENNLKKILNTPYSELLKIWEDKQIYRDQYDEEWFIGTNLHCGKLGSEHIKRFVIENKKELN